jgi:hypothetical protein
MTRSPFPLAVRQQLDLTEHSAFRPDLVRAARLFGGNHCAIRGLILPCLSRSGNVSRSWRNHAGLNRINHWML